MAPEASPFEPLAPEPPPSEPPATESQPSPRRGRAPVAAPTLGAADFVATIEALVRTGSSGAVLRQARLMRRISISDVGATTRIRPEYVAAMEDGTPGVLPPGRYGLSLYRSYAIFLGVPPDDIVRMRDLEAGRRARSVSIFGARVSVQSSRRLVAVAVIVTALALAATFWHVLQPLGTGEIEAATARALAQATYLPGITAAPTRMPPAATVSLPTAAPAPTTAPVPSRVLGGAPTATSEPASPGRVAAPVSGPVDPGVVTLSFLEESWVRVSVDGTLVFEGTARPNERRNYSGDVVAVVIGNAAGVDLVAFGDRVGVVGKTGEVFEAIYRRPSG